MMNEELLDSDVAVQANRNYKDTVFRMLFLTGRTCCHRSMQ